MTTGRIKAWWRRLTTATRQATCPHNERRSENDGPWTCCKCGKDLGYLPEIDHLLEKQSQLMDNMFKAARRKP